MVDYNLAGARVRTLCVRYVDRVGCKRSDDGGSVGYGARLLDVQ